MSRLAVLFLPSGAAGAGYEQPDKSRAICNLAGPRAWPPKPSRSIHSPAARSPAVRPSIRRP